ncbi:MAG TPA: hypothetical protein PLO19_05145 [Candidatus Cryosericum sp.]|nr:hypothetical protein [Candidatus Cryosericum sp.]
MKARKGPLHEAEGSSAEERLRSIADPDEARTAAQAVLRESLTRTASELFTPEELPRYLQLQLAGPPEGIASWKDLTGERLTQLGVAHHSDGVRADDSGMLAPTMVPVTIDYAVLVEGREVCSSAGYDPGTTASAFEGGVHRVSMTAPDVTVTRIAFPHTLMELPFIDVTFRLHNTSDQFHAVTLLLLVKPFDEDGIGHLERFALTSDNLIVLNRQTVAFACERPTSLAASVYDPRSGRMVAADVTGEVVSQAGLMQVRFGFDHQLEPGGDAEVTFFFYVDRTARHTHEELTLLLAQSAGILEQEHRLVVTQPAQVGYQTGDARLNRFAANQLLHLGALQSEAARCLQGAGGATSLMALVQAYDRTGEAETASGLLRSYAAQVPVRPQLSGEGMLRGAGFAIALGWHLSATRQLQLRRQLFPVVDQFIAALAQSSMQSGPVALSLVGSLRRSGPALYLMLGKAIESYQGMLSDKDEARLRLCDELQLRLLKQADAASVGTGHAVPDFSDMAAVAVHALFGAHGMEEAVLTGVLGWAAGGGVREGLVVNPYQASLGDVRLSLLLDKALILHGDNRGVALLHGLLDQLGPSGALPDYIDQKSGRGLAGPRHSAVATALALELLTSLIFVERGSYLSIIPVPVAELFAGDGINVHGLQSTFGELSVRMQRTGDKVTFSMHSDFLRGVGAIELNFPWELRELVARKGAVKYVTGGTIVMEPADLIEGEAIVAGPGPV